MKKVYMVIFILAHIFYWTIVLDQTEGRGKALAVLMILLSLLVEILLLNRIRKTRQTFRVKPILIMEILSGLEWLLFFILVIKALTQETSFYDATIECRTFFFISVVSLLIIPSSIRNKTLGKVVDVKYPVLVLILFLAVDRFLLGIPNDNFVHMFYTSASLSIANSNLSILMFLAWIINVEFVKKQLVMDKE